MAQRPRPALPDFTTEGPFSALSVQLTDIVRELAELRRAVTALTQQIAAAPNRAAAPEEHDPGDSVPPGVAVQAPAPLTDDDRKTLRRLKRLPRR